MVKNKLETQYQDSEQSLGLLIWKTSNKLQRLHRQALKELDITPTQFSVLASIVYISSSTGPITQAELCHHTQMDKMLISDIVKVLVKKKWVHKKRSPIDSRAYLISPTQTGTTLANASVKIVESIDQKFFEPIKNKTQFNKDLIQILKDE